jgi:hypothetical protein
MPSYSEGLETSSCISRITINDVTVSLSKYGDTMLFNVAGEDGDDVTFGVYCLGDLITALKWIEGNLPPHA